MIESLKNFGKQYFIIPNNIRYELSDKFESYKFQEYDIFFSKDFSSYTRVSNGKKVFILGEIYDVRNQKDNIDDLLLEILEYDTDSTEFLEKLSYCNGRYILILEEGESLSLYTDATSLISCYYHTRRDIYASHSVTLHALLKEIYKIDEPQRYANSGGFLDHSKFDNIYKLNCNMKLNVNFNSRKRIFPYKELRELDYLEISEKHNELLLNSADYIVNNNKNVILTLTGGYDTRLTLALFKKYSNQINYLTYTFNFKVNNWRTKVYKIDENQTLNIANNLNLNHKLVNVDNIPPVKEVKELYPFFETQYSSKVINYYANNYKEKNTALLKSTIYGLAKPLYGKKLKDYPYDINKVIPILITWTKYIKKNEKMKMKKILRSYMDRNDSEAALNSGIDPYYLFYYEARLNNWNASMAQESDNYVDTQILVNYREATFDFCMMNYDDKKKYRLHLNLIEKNWPILNYFNYNNFGDLSKKVNRLESNISNKHIIASKHLRFKKHRIKSELGLKGKVFKIEDDEISKNKEYFVDIKNNSLYEKKIELITKYKNEKGKGHINIVIDNEKKDLYDMSQQKTIVKIPQNSEISVRIENIHSKNLVSKSWINAAKFELIELN